jgi:CubicO group peptidase (beta-lactamase class C family)
VDSALLARMFGAIRQSRLNVHSVLIIRNGHVVADAYLHPFGRDTKHILHSAAKSVISALVGIALDQGRIESLDRPVLDFFPNRKVAHPDADKKAMTLKHLLTMTSGQHCPDTAENQSTFTRELQQSPDWVQFMLDLPMDAAPGTLFHYSNGIAFLLSAILQEVTVGNALAYAREYLFGPLGITDAFWLSNLQDITIGYGRLWLKPHDMAKIGNLFLRGGMWNGKRVISSPWIEASTSPQIRSNGSGYGFQWWVENTGGYYAARGFAGQSINVLPGRNMVVVFTGGLTEADLLDDMLMDHFILPASVSSDPLPANPEGVSSLDSQILTLAVPEPIPMPPLPDTAKKISGKRYLLAEKTLGHWDVFFLAFPEEESPATLRLGEPALELPTGLDGVYRVTFLEKNNFVLLFNINRNINIDQAVRAGKAELSGSLALKGSWQTDDTFVIQEQIAGEHEVLEMTFAFDAAGVNLSERTLIFAVSQGTRGTPQKEV